MTQIFSGTPVNTCVNPGFFELSSMILVTTFTSSLFSALTVVLIYKVSRYFTKSEKIRVLLSIAYGLGTLAFPYATVFFSHAASTFFAFLAFFLLFKVKKEKIASNFYWILSGLSIGFAVTCDYFIAPILFGLLIFAASFRRKDKTLLFILSLLLGIAPLLLYNFSIFGNPLELTLWHSDPKIFSSVFTFQPNPYIVIRLLVFPYRGLFYSPIILLSLLGLYYMYKEYRLESLLILSFLVSFLFLFSMVSGWWGGTSFGPRYLMPIIPFLMIPMIYSFRKINIKIIFCLVIVSIFINFLGLQNWENEIVDSNTLRLLPNYQEKVNSFQTLENPLGDYYLPLFFDHGPRSRIFESIMNNDFHDIRDVKDTFSTNNFYSSPISISIPSGILTFKISFITISFLLIAIFLIWRKELLKHFDKKIIPIFSIILVIFILFFTSINKTIYDKNWYTPETQDNITYRWMSQNATFLFFEPAKTLDQVKFVSSSYYQPRVLDVYLNDIKISSFEITKVSDEFTLPLFVSQAGKNTIKFYSKEGCDRISGIENQSDPRCISFAFRNISVENIDNIVNFINKSYDKNWYDLEVSGNASFRWMSQNATLTIFNLKPSSFENVTMNLRSYYKPRVLQIFLNNTFVSEYNITPENGNINLNLNLSQGENLIKFHSLEGCNIPKEVENSIDVRCLSFAFKEMKLEE